jgi:hypothetical protein
MAPMSNINYKSEKKGYNFLKLQLHPIKNHGKVGKRQGFGEWAIKLEGIHILMWFWLLCNQ